jgi:hypothetical protein
MIIKNRKEKTCIRTDVAIPADRNVIQKEPEGKLKVFMYVDTSNVELEMYYYTASNWSHRNCNKYFEEKFGSHARKTFNRFTTTDSSTCNITHNTESTAV